jgi:ABC-type iron transport system FetAB permease component
MAVVAGISSLWPSLVILVRWSFRGEQRRLCTVRMLVQRADGYALAWIFEHQQRCSDLLVLGIMLLASSWIAGRSEERTGARCLSASLGYNGGRCSRWH